MFRPTRRSGADRFRTVASQPTARSVAGRIPPALRHRALHGAGAAARRARRSAQRPVFARRAAVFLHHRRAAVRRERNPARHAAAAVARSVSAAQAEAGLSALAAGDRAAVPGDRAGLAPPDGVATGVRTGPSRAGQTDRAIGAAAARSAQHRAAPPLQPRPDASRSRNPMSPRNWLRGRSWRSRSISRKARSR